MTSERIKQVVLKSQFFKDLKQQLQTTIESVLQLEYIGSENMINEILTEINSKLDSLQSDVSVLIIDKDQLQTIISNLEDRITAIEPKEIEEEVK